MKHLFTLLILLNLPTASGQSALEWVSLSHFDTIDLPGKKLVFKQLCTNSTDSIIANGSATFLRAEIRNLGACSYSRSFTDTVLSKVELFSSDKKSWDSFLAYFTTLVNRNYTVVPDKKTNPVYRLLCEQGQKSESRVLRLQKQEKITDCSDGRRKLNHYSQNNPIFVFFSSKRVFA